MGFFSFLNSIIGASENPINLGLSSKSKTRISKQSAFFAYRGVKKTYEHFFVEYYCEELGLWQKIGYPLLTPGGMPCMGYSHFKSYAEAEAAIPELLIYPHRHKYSKHLF